MPVLPGIKVFVALRILTEEVPRGPVLVGEGHVQLPILLHQPLELTISSNLSGGVGLLDHNVKDHLVIVVVVVVVVVLQVPDGRLSLSLQPFCSSISRDADTGTSFGTTVHRCGWILTEDFAKCLFGFLCKVDVGFAHIFIFVFVSKDIFVFLE